MARKNFHKELVVSDVFAQYSLRSTFFVRRLRGMRLWDAIGQVHRLTKVEGSFLWDDRASWGIDQNAWDRVRAKQINPLLVFCHPRAITEQPQLLLYYRTAALISQKGLKSLIGGNVEATEAGQLEQLDDEWLKQAVVALNSLLSAVVNAAAELEQRDLAGFQFASAGATIQGAWNNAIGSEGEAAVRSILVNHLRDELLQIVWQDGKSTDYASELHTDLLDRIADVRVVRMKHGFHLRFASEPDISLRNVSDVPLAAIEIKAGADPAGALERLGAAMKSFDNDRNLNPRLKTIYVVRCITPELQKRIRHNNPFDHTFGLSELLVDERTQRTFANLVLRAVLAQRKTKP